MTKNPNFDQKYKFWSKIQIVAKYGNVAQKSKFWSKIEIFVTEMLDKSRNFFQTSTEKINQNLTMKNTEL